MTGDVRERPYPSAIGGRDQRVDRGIVFQVLDLRVRQSGREIDPVVARRTGRIGRKRIFGRDDVSGRAAVENALSALDAANKQRLHAIVRAARAVGDIAEAAWILEALRQRRARREGREARPHRVRRIDVVRVGDEEVLLSRRIEQDADRIAGVPAVQAGIGRQQIGRCVDFRVVLILLLGPEIDAIGPVGWRREFEGSGPPARIASGASSAP